MSTTTTESTTSNLSLEEIEIIFRKCFDFVNELNDVFGTDHPELALYHKLMDKGPKHEKALRTQVSVFEKALLSCHEAIVKEDISNLVEQIEFSKRVFIPIKQICIESDDATAAVIFNHLQVILMLLKPDQEESKELKHKIMNEIKREKQEQEELASDKEAMFLNNFMGDIERTLDGKEFNNPADAIADLFKNGKLFQLANEIGSGIQNGSLNLDKLVGKVTSRMDKDTQSQVGSVFNTMSSFMGIQMPENVDPLAMLSSLTKGSTSVSVDEQQSEDASTEHDSQQDQPDN